MTDTATNFDPIPRLQQIATIIKESGADIFYAPTTVAYDIECAIKEIERLRRDYSCICGQMRRMMEERDEARRSVCEMSIQLGGVYRRVGGKTVEVTTPEGCAEIMRWDCFKKDSNGTE